MSNVVDLSDFRAKRIALAVADAAFDLSMLRSMMAEEARYLAIPLTPLEMTMMDLYGPPEQNTETGSGSGPA